LEEEGQLGFSLSPEAFQEEGLGRMAKRVPRIGEGQGIPSVGNFGQSYLIGGQGLINFHQVVRPDLKANLRLGIL